MARTFKISYVNSFNGLLESKISRKKIDERLTLKYFNLGTTISRAEFRSLSFKKYIKKNIRHLLFKKMCNTNRN